MAHTDVEGRLSEYIRRRDFAKTAEPKGGRKRAGAGLYAVQKHAARRLHYDFRLELDGVLLSWAVTRGPSTDPADKRLAVRTEDHPLDYADFEGTIPEGNYGAGTVMLWDIGRWEPHGDPREGLEKGKLAFTLYGERLSGGWALIRMKPRKREKRENWLLIKERDAEAAPEDDPRERFRTSVKTGRDLDEIAGDAAPKKPAVRAARQGKSAGRKPSTKRRAVHQGALPAFVPPALATLVDAPPAGEGWLHEIKWDGYRALAAVAGDRVRIYSRSGQDWTDRFASLVEPLRSLDLGMTLIDGEVVVRGEDGRGDFSRLQKALSEGGPLSFMAFDLLRDGDNDLRRKPLTARKARLEELIGAGNEAVAYCSHIEGQGEEVHAQACRIGLEGIVSKRAAAPYRSGRHRDWVKSKCSHREEFVIGGYRPSKAAGRPFSSLLLGSIEDGKLVYRGRVGTGFDGRILADLARRMKPLARKTPAFEAVPREVRRDARWLEPELVAEIGYTERTADGHLRHPVYHGLREDKPASAVSLDRPVRLGEARRTGDGGTTVAGVRLSNPDKVLFPQQGITKAELAGYLASVAERMLPYLAGRPLTVLRCPQGRAAKCFIQRHHAEGMPAGIRPVAIREKSKQRADYLYIEDAAGLAGAAQIGALELHVWGARRDRIETPERIVFDLDPAENVAFSEVRRAARDIRELLAAAGLETFPLLTGGKGIHVIAPLVPEREWAEIEAFTRGFAYALATAEPDRFIAKASKAARRGRIFVDWLRNQRGATAVAPYSPRARAGAPVATPVSWDELSRIDSAAAYSIEGVQRRLARLRKDPWAGYFDCQQRIGDETLNLFRNTGQRPPASERRRSMAKSHGKQVKDDKRYEELRGKGMSKEKAARIANAAANPKQKPSKKGGKSPTYEEWTKEDLLDRARSIGIEGRSKMKKDELIDAIRSH